MDEILSELRALRTEIRRAREAVKKARLRELNGPPKLATPRPPLALDERISRLDDDDVEDQP